MNELTFKAASNLFNILEISVVKSTITSLGYLLDIAESTDDLSLSGAEVLNSSLFRLQFSRQQLIHRCVEIEHCSCRS